MYLARQITDFSTTEIGMEFGGRDHTTVMYANNRVESLMKGDEAYAATVNKLRRQLTSS
jgi:chromosomal replication initiator protein